MEDPAVLEYLENMAIDLAVVIEQLKLINSKLDNIVTNTKK